MRFTAIVFALYSFLLTPSCGGDSSFQTAGAQQAVPEMAAESADAEVEEPVKEKPLANEKVTEKPAAKAPASIEDVNRLCANRTQKTMKQKITFAPAPQKCAWGQNGNLPLNVPVNLVVSARNEQKVALSFPKNAILCEMDFIFAPQTIVYDDEIIISLNNLVLASSQNYSQELKAKGKYLEYDWKNLVGKPYRISDRNIFCVGEAEGKGKCNIPPTQRQGTIELDIDGAAVKELGIASGLTSFEDKGGQSKTTTSAANFGLVTFGDNDDAIDCQHSGFSFDVEYQFVEMEN